MKKVTIRGQNYWFDSGFQHKEEWRHGFNTLAKSTFGFDFEDYYKSGYWNNRYIPYALKDGSQVVANVSANILDFSVFKERKQLIQIGTVMTDQQYRGRGLSKYLLETVITQWKNKSDLIYLFANDTVLDFYPKFGFSKKMEYQYERAISNQQKGATVRQLDMNRQSDRELLFHLSDTTLPFGQLTALHNTGLVLFYATSSMKNDFYYIEDRNTAICAQYQGNTLLLHDLFTPANISIELLIASLARPGITQVKLGFTPLETEDYSCKPFLQEDNTLFVLSEKETPFDTHRLMLPILSHA